MAHGIMESGKSKIKCSLLAQQAVGPAELMFQFQSEGSPGRADVEVCWRILSSQGRPVLFFYSAFNQLDENHQYSKGNLLYSQSTKLTVNLIQNTPREIMFDQISKHPVAPWPTQVYS